VTCANALPRPKKWGDGGEKKGGGDLSQPLFSVQHVMAQGNLAATKGTTKPNA